MVFISKYLRNEVKRWKKLRGTYLDKIRVHVKGGTGGMGNPKYGGIGGKGGDVYVKGAADLRSVVNSFPEKHIYAGHGGNSIAKQLLGVRGNDLRVEVPCGVKVITEFNTIIGEINQINETLLVAKGGIGGCPATNFSGMRGQKYSVTLELCIISDVSIVGFPNAGKSTFLKACSRARPRIAEYPFTTIKPNVGIMQYMDERRITIADLPGLIEGAHMNFGMGHQFLRHVERSRAIMMIVDVAGFQLKRDRPFRTAFETVMLLNKELELYNPEILKKPISLVVNKMDLPNAQDEFQILKDKLGKYEEIECDLPDFIKPTNLIKFEEIIPISAKSGQDVEVVKDHLRGLIDSLAAENQSDIDEKFEKLKMENNEFGPTLI